LLAGRGVEALREVAEREGVGPRVLLLGDREDVPQLLAALDIVCCSSITEGLPNNIGEAMSAGVPCVVTDAGDTGWLVGDTGRVVPRRDPQALAGALLEMIEIGAEGRNRLGARARERIRREFSMDAHVEQMEQMFEQLVGKQ
jgi:glycosyltransferase involved in cell wall biosynthesis